MNRREFTLSLAGAGSAVLIGCEPDQKPASTATITNNDAIKSAMDGLDGVAGSLEEDSDNFGGGNWRDVVPAVQEHIEQLRGALSDLRAALQYPS